MSPPTTRHAARSNRTAFDVLTVEGVDDSDDDVSSSPPASPPPSKSNAAFSASTKKGRAKQRARDRARKDTATAQPAVDAPSSSSLSARPLAATVPQPAVDETNGLSSNEPPAPPPVPVTVTLTQPSPPDHDHDHDHDEDKTPPPVVVADSSASGYEAPPFASTTASVISSVANSVEASESEIDDPQVATEVLPSSDLTTPRPDFDPKWAASQTYRRASVTSLPPQTEPNYGTDHQAGKKIQSIITRVIWSLVMVSIFIGLMLLGHVYLIVLVFVLQVAVFREVTGLFEVGYKASAKAHIDRNGIVRSISRSENRLQDVENDRWSKVMSWYFFVAVNYFLYGESIVYYFKHIVFVDAYFLPFARHHRFISLLLYLTGFLTFVANLDRDHLRRQFGLFSWIHMSMLLIVVSSHFMVYNILEGLIWFWVPACCVIMNDVAAYVFGMLFGRHQLIKLSPKKTVEGFVGGYFATVTFAYVWGTCFQRFNYMICPVRDLGVTAFSSMQCTPNSAFVWHSVTIPDTIASPFLSRLLFRRDVVQFWWTPFQLHAIVLGTFAGLVAPFGGFFASGFKRAYNIKDFGDTIPGHGGLTDRFDCQFVMGMFAYFYYSSLVRENHVSVGMILELVQSSLSPNEQLELFRDLRVALASQGIKT